MLNLYTVTIDFEDRTQGIEQLECASEVEALRLALFSSKALVDYDRKKIEKFCTSCLRITHLAEGYKGVWLWHSVSFDDEDFEEIEGGCIVQTDKSGAIREEGS